VALLGLGFSIGATPAPVVHFSFDLYDGEISDSVGVQSLALPSGVSVKADGVSGSYFSLKRQEDFMLSMSKSFGFADDFSISFWMRTSPGYTDSGSILLGRHLTSSCNGYWFMLNSGWGYGAMDKLVFFLFQRDDGVHKTMENDGRWHHVGLVYRRSQGAFLFIDGALNIKGPVNPILILDAHFVLGGITWDKPRGTPLLATSTS
jgi:hypothetical protein